MHIYTKKQFNKFAELFLDEVKSATNYNIKKLKFFEVISKGMGFNSHNELLEYLPLDMSHFSHYADAIVDGLNTTFGMTSDNHQIARSIYSASNTYRSLPPSFIFNLDNTDVEIPKNDISPFASIEPVTSENENSFALTSLGILVNDAIDEIFLQVRDGDIDINEAENLYAEYLGQYKHNIYVRALWLNGVVPYIWQCDWEPEDVIFGNFELSEDSRMGYEFYAYDFAKDYLKEASTIATELLRQVGDKINNWCPRKIILFNNISHDSITLIDSLHYAAKINLNAKRYKRARHFFKIHKAAFMPLDTEHKYLAILAAMEKGGKVSDYVDIKSESFISMALTVIELLKNKKFAEAKSLYRKTCVHYLGATPFSMIDMPDLGEYRHASGLSKLTEAYEIMHYAFHFDKDNESDDFEAINAPLSALRENNFLEKLLEYHHFYSNHIFGCNVNLSYKESMLVKKKANDMKEALLVIC